MSLIEILISLLDPISLFPWRRRDTCEHCGGRLKYVKLPEGKKIQCVMCERWWMEKPSTTVSNHRK